MVKYIPLSQNQVAIVDDEDFEKLNTMKWCSHKHGNTFYALRRVKRSHEKFTCMHNDLLFAESPLEIDHVNGNGLDNRKCNLRIVTHRQNCQNFHHNKSSIYPGVCWAKNNKKWKVRRI